MNYISAVVSDQGNVRINNQDSVLVRISEFENYGQVAFAGICDGMGGYAKGELASATVISHMEEWFDTCLPGYISYLNSDLIIEEWMRILSKANNDIHVYGENRGIKLGTTFSGIVFFGDEYVLMHIGDSRIYHVNEEVIQVTEDHSFVAREVKRGNLSEEEARVDPRRNVLLQCVGLSKQLKPDVKTGKVVENDVFFLCSDGLYHTFDREDLSNILLFSEMKNVGSMHKICKFMVDAAKKNGEKDNLSMILVKCTNEKKMHLDETGMIQNIKLIHTDEKLL